jgi:hypothetical protein
MLIICSINGTNATCQPIVRQGPPVPVNFCIHSNEMELYLMINEYRKQFSLPPIPLSKSLSYTAALHAKDLLLNHPDQGTCNFHSWSNKGTWTPFCYPKDETKKSSVWDKPHELTRYPSKAYEIVYWENNPLVTDTIIMVWKTEDYFNSFLLNNGKWLGKSWNAIGIAVYENYACAWFGETPDPEGETYVCGSIPPIKPKDTVAVDVKPIVKPAATQKKGKTGKKTSNNSDSLAIKRTDSLPEKSAETKLVNTGSLNVSNDSVSGIYYIIVKTSLPLEAAGKLVNTLRSGEYPDAKVLEKDNKIRVSVFESPDKPTASAKLKEVKKIYKDAWLLKR